MLRNRNGQGFYHVHARHVQNTNTVLLFCNQYRVDNVSKDIPAKSEVLKEDQPIAS